MESNVNLALDALTFSLTNEKHDKQYYMQTNSFLCEWTTASLLDLQNSMFSLKNVNFSNFPNAIAQLEIGKV